MESWQQFIHRQLVVTVGSSIQRSSFVHVTVIPIEQAHFILFNTHPIATIRIALTSIQKQCNRRLQMNIAQSKLLESSFG